MGRKARSKTCQPEPLVGPTFLDPFLESEQDGWTAAVPVFPQNMPCFTQLKSIEFRLEGIYHIPAPGVRDHLIRISTAAGEELPHRL